MSRERERVALVDDDPTAGEMLSVLLDDAGYEAIGVQPPLESIDGAIAQIRSVASAAICDHRLRPQWPVNFDGAELVAQLCASDFPAVLISQFWNTDQNVSIRKHRSKIPVLLSRNEVGPDQLVDAFRTCVEEINGKPSPQRKAWRTLVRVIAKDTQGGEDVLDAIIPGWRPNEAVRFPAELLGPHRCKLPAESSDRLELRFVARVNIGAEDARDLYFEGFEPAIEPQNDNILA